ALFLGLALVVELLAARQRQLDLGTTLLVEIELERDQRHAIALDCADQFVDLAAVQQKLARPLRRVIEAVRLPIFGNVRVDEPDFPAAGVGVGFPDRGLALTQLLHLRSGERDARLHGLVDKVVETRLAVVGDDTELSFSLRRHAAVPLSDSLARRESRSAAALPWMAPPAPAALPLSID